MTSCSNIINETGGIKSRWHLGAASFLSRRLFVICLPVVTVKEDLQHKGENGVQRNGMGSEKRSNPRILARICGVGKGK